jgi:hypothetical protein
MLLKIPRLTVSIGQPLSPFWFSMAILDPLLPHANSGKKTVGKHNMLLMDFPTPNSGYLATIRTFQKVSI